MLPATTDGFITGIDDLENKLLDLPNEETVLIYTNRSLKFYKQ